MQGFAVKPVYQVVMEAFPDTPSRGLRTFATSRRSRSRNWPRVCHRRPRVRHDVPGTRTPCELHHSFKNLAFLAAPDQQRRQARRFHLRQPIDGHGGLQRENLHVGNSRCQLLRHVPPEGHGGEKWAGGRISIRVLWCCNGNMLSCRSGRQDLIDAVKGRSTSWCARTSTMTDLRSGPTSFCRCPIRSRCRISTR